MRAQTLDVNKDQYLILCAPEPDAPYDGWHDCGEGPFDTYAQAQEFADAEVGAEHIIVRVARSPRPAGGPSPEDFTAAADAADALEDLQSHPWVTEDGYTLTWSDRRHMWTDGDLYFAAGDDGAPVDDAGERLTGGSKIPGPGRNS